MAGVLSPSVDDDTTLTIVCAVGGRADDVEGVRVPLEGTHVGAVQRAGSPRAVEDISTMPVHGRLDAVSVELTRGYGPALIAPLGTCPGTSLLVALRRTGREAFTAEDLELLSGFAAQAAVALELAHSQQRERRLQLQAHPGRGARHPHPHDLPRDFAAALSLGPGRPALRAERPPRSAERPS